MQARRATNGRPYRPEYRGYGGVGQAALPPE